MPDLPEEAVEAAQKALYDWCSDRDWVKMRPDEMAGVALQAAAPAIRKRERERVRGWVGEGDVKKLRQISEILSGPDNHHGIYLSQLASNLLAALEDSDAS